MARYSHVSSASGATGAPGPDYTPHLRRLKAAANSLTNLSYRFDTAAPAAATGSAAASANTAAAVTTATALVATRTPVHASPGASTVTHSPVPRPAAMHATPHPRPPDESKAAGAGNLVHDGSGADTTTAHVKDTAPTPTGGAASAAGESPTHTPYLDAATTVLATRGTDDRGYPEFLGSSAVRSVARDSPRRGDSPWIAHDMPAHGIGRSYVSAHPNETLASAALATDSAAATSAARGAAAPGDGVDDRGPDTSSASYFSLEQAARGMVARVGACIDRHVPPHVASTAKVELEEIGIRMREVDRERLRHLETARARAREIDELKGEVSGCQRRIEVLTERFEMADTRSAKAREAMLREQGVAKDMREAYATEQARVASLSSEVRLLKAAVENGKELAKTLEAEKAAAVAARQREATHWRNVTHPSLWPSDATLAAAAVSAPPPPMSHAGAAAPVPLPDAAQLMAAGAFNGAGGALGFAGPTAAGHGTPLDDMRSPRPYARIIASELQQLQDEKDVRAIRDQLSRERAASLASAARKETMFATASKLRIPGFGGHAEADEVPGSWGELYDKRASEIAAASREWEQVSEGAWQTAQHAAHTAAWRSEMETVGGVIDGWSDRVKDIRERSSRGGGGATSADEGYAETVRPQAPYGIATYGASVLDAPAYDRHAPVTAPATVTYSSGSRTYAGPPATFVGAGPRLRGGVVDTARIPSEYTQHAPADGVGAPWPLRSAHMRSPAVSGPYDAGFRARASRSPAAAAAAASGTSAQRRYRDQDTERDRSMATLSDRVNRARMDRAGDTADVAGYVKQQHPAFRES